MQNLLTEMNHYFAKIVRVPGEVEEPLVTEGPLVVARPEYVSLNIARSLHENANRIQDDTGDVTPRSEGDLGVPLNVGRVQDGDGQGYGPDPDYLEEPEYREGPELVSQVVEAVIFACFQDPIEQEAREAQGPGDEKRRDDDLAHIVGATQTKR